MSVKLEFECKEGFSEIIVRSLKSIFKDMKIVKGTFSYYILVKNITKDILDNINSALYSYKIKGVVEYFSIDEVINIV